MSTVREWGATFWARPEDSKRILDMAAVETRNSLLDEVPDAVILAEETYSTTPLSWTDIPEEYDFLGVLIKYTSDSQDRA